MERRSKLTELQIHIIDILSKVEHPHTFFKDAGVTGECITNWTSGARAPTDIVSIQDALKAVGYEVFVRRITEPTIEAVNEWIPCSERLPSEYEEVLVCDKDGTMEVCDLETFSRGVGLKWTDKNGYECWLDVIAWMPLPKPWKGADDER